MTSSGSKRVYCNTCGRETNHLTRGEYEIKEDVNDEGAFEAETHRLLSCAGCDTPTLETQTSLFDPSEGESSLHDLFSYQPERNQQSHNVKLFRRIPPKLRAIYRQSVAAYNHSLPVLCAAGFRALIEGICADKKIVGRNLEKKIDAMEAILPKNIVENLHGFRFMGNDAVHELAAPKMEDLKIAIDVSEDLLNFLYELDYKASQLPKKAKPASGQP